MFKRMKIHAKVMFAVIFVSTLSLLSMTFASYVIARRIADYSETINRDLGTKAISGSGDALMDQAYDFLDTIVTEQSKAADVVLQNISLNVSLVEGAVREIFSNPKSYASSEMIVPSPPADGYFESKWRLPAGVETTDEIEMEILLLSNLNMITPTLANDPSVFVLYVGTENGLFYDYASVPVKIVDPGFDPRTRPWYIKALAHPDKVVFTDVYVDAYATGLVMTAAKAVFADDGSLIGVAGIDVRLDVLKDLILGTRVADTGYVFLLDKNGVYVVHPDMDMEKISGFNPEVSDSFRDGLTRMTEGESGFIKIDERGEVMYLAFAPLSAAEFSVGAVVPESQILSSRDILSRQISSIVDEAATSIRSMSSGIIWTFFVVFVLCILMVLAMGMYLTHIISNPIDRLENEVSIFGHGALKNRINIETQDEIGSLARVFNQMADNIVRNMEELTAAATERERVNSELRIAAQIQSDMLPNIDEKFKDHPYVDLHARIEPAQEMGGDLYDVFFADKTESKLCVVVADVSGKGMPAAMFMILAKTLIRNYILNGDTPADALKKANNRLCEDNPTSMFVTAVVAIADISTGYLEYSSAGHNPTAYCPRGGTFSFVQTEKTMPLGFLPDNLYPLYTTIIGAGDKFFLYTDGVTEALSPDDVLWGDEALLAALNDSRDKSCLEIANYVRECVAKHANGAEQSDDITILSIGFRKSV